MMTLYEETRVLSDNLRGEAGILRKEAERKQIIADAKVALAYQLDILLSKEDNKSEDGD